MKICKRIIAAGLALLSIAFCGCNNKKTQSEEPEVLPTVAPYKEPEKLEEIIQKTYTMNDDDEIVSSDGAVYAYYTSQENISVFSDFNLYENMSNYLGYIEGQKLTEDVWNELGYKSYEDYMETVGDFEYGVYGIMNVPGKDNAEEEPELIMVYFYNKEDEKTYAESRDESITKARYAEFYRRVDNGTQINEFDYKNCSAFALSDSGWSVDEDLRDNGGIRDRAEVAEFIEYLNTAQLLSENPVQDGYYSYLYEHFYNKKTNKFNDSPEYEKAKKQRKTLKLVGVLKDNDAFAISFTVEKYGEYGYSVNIGGIDYVLTKEWAEKLLA